ncbi:hypothetical protein ELG97_32110 (plasmid) [Rhizobium leguminosarum]|uniref:Multi-ubiquitin domain-containing protein n=1 Tax=Rhizobium leguminosarum TaxID=384 RepID=A0A7M3DI73_RHILE|nr:MULTISPECIES: multiubiquitin domain-containing protein [Rhizobium]TAU37393.1 hypothetical protein ELI42_34920 [Rhizobium ruizarguesonis]TAU46514.1 hypothetical protein ELI44_34625 [Rhizobium ruizarguesonis]TAY41475.1 hypothetical protein ELH90_38130 [Rhizobium leguminosarum]TBC60661.1 hypothetical protein ELH27_34180 [Rhizobium leguminosarum]TBC86857.1 hypothetical protein ELH21_36505 [Rhizobium leguminosarum]
MQHISSDNRADGAPLDDGVEINRTAGYRLLYGDNGLDFRPLVLPDPIPLGRQILEAAGVRDIESTALAAILAGGAMEDIRLSEPYDLSGRGVERVIGFRTDTLYRAFLVGRELIWGRREIRGEELYALADLTETEALYIDVPGGTDVHVKRDSVIDLSEPGVERFIAGPVPAPEGFEISVNYNGIVRQVRVRPRDLISSIIETVRPLFGNPGGDLVLIDTASGRVLEPAHTVAQEGVHVGAQLQLRAPIVRGG